MWKLATLFSIIVTGADVQPTLNPIGTQEIHANSVMLSAIAGQILLQWDPSTNPDIAGYKIYWGFVSRSYYGSLDAGPLTTARISGLQPGRNYYFTVTGYGKQGLESAFSNEVRYIYGMQTGLSQQDWSGYR